MTMLVNGIRRRHLVRRAKPACILMVMLLSLILPVPMAHAQLDEQARDHDLVDPAARTVGIYITSLRDFDAGDDSFGVDLWI